jgi:YgiT-type zinc finger domain-containing protein
MKEDKTTYMADLGTCIVIVKSVPCHKCTQCGEVAYSLAVGKRLEQIVDALENSLTEVAIVQYSDKVA